MSKTPMPPSTSEVLQTLNPSKIILPIIIGLGVVLFLLLKNLNVETFSNIDWSWTMTLWIVGGIVLLMVRHYMLMYRIRVFTDNKLSWWQSFDVITLWEFGSAATPSVVGGTAVALFLLTKEKINAGTTISIILFTIFLDSLFLITTIPILWIALGKGLLAPSLAIAEVQEGTLWLYPFFIGYCLMFAYTFVIGYGLFVKPKTIKWIIVKLTSLPFINRWKSKAIKTGNDLIIASGELKKKDTAFWLKGIFITGGIWVMRFLILNFVVAAFLVVGSHLLLFGRQVILYILMMLAPTPGGSGIAEVAFRAFLSDFFLENKDGAMVINEGLWVIVAAIWRLISYYPYLFLGVIVLPSWLRRVFKKEEIEEDEVA